MLLGNRNTLVLLDLLDYSEDSQHTAGINLQGFPVLGLLVPVLNNSPIITVEISLDGSTWLAVMKSNSTTAAVSIQGGATAFAVGSDELTQLAAYCGHLRTVPDLKVRLVLSVAQTADRIFSWVVLA